MNFGEFHLIFNFCFVLGDGEEIEGQTAPGQTEERKEGQRDC